MHFCESGLHSRVHALNGIMTASRNESSIAEIKNGEQRKEQD